MGVLLFAFLAVAGQAPPAAPIAMSDVISDLRKKGITVQNCLNHWGTMTGWRCTVDVSFTVERKEPATVSHVYFAGRLAASKRSSQSQLADWLVLRRGQPPVLTLFAQIDGTISYQSQISVTADYTRELLVKEIESHVGAYDAFQHDFHALPVAKDVQPRMSDVDFDHRLDTADPTDLQILTTLWGLGVHGTVLRDKRELPVGLPRDNPREDGDHHIRPTVQRQLRIRDANDDQEAVRRNR